MIQTAPLGKANQNPHALTVVVSLGFVLTGVVCTFLGPILPVLSSRWTLTDAQSGYFFALQFYGSVMGAVLSSVSLPRLGSRLTISMAYLLMAAGVTGLASSQWPLALLGTFWFGVGFGLVIPATNLLVSSIHYGRRAAALSILNFCWGLGALLSPTAVFFALRAKRVSMFVISLSGLLVLQAASLSFTSDTQTLPVRRTETIDLSAYRNRYAVILGGMFFLYVAIESSVGGWIATLAARLPAGASTGWVMAPSLFWGGLLAGRGLAPFVLLRMQERSVALAGLMVAGSGMCILVVNSNWVWVTIAGFVSGLGLAAVYPITIALLSQLRENENRLAGPMFALAGLGGATMPWLVGAVSTWSGSLKAGLIVPLLGTVTLLWLHMIGNRGQEETAKDP